MCFSQDGHLLASGSKDCTWRLWDVNGNIAPYRRNINHSIVSKLLHVSTLLVRYHLSEDPRCLHTVKMEHAVDNVSFSPDSKTLLVISNGDFHFYDTKTASLVSTIDQPHAGMPFSTATTIPSFGQQQKFLPGRAAF